MNCLAVIENLSMDYYYEFNEMYVQIDWYKILKYAPKNNNLLSYFSKSDIQCRFYSPFSDYKYKHLSIGNDFIFEWYDLINNYNKNINIHPKKEILKWKNRELITKPRIVFIKSIYYIGMLQYVEINHSIMKFFHKIKKYYSNKIKMKKSPKFLLYRQIHGHFPKKI